MRQTDWIIKILFTCAFVAFVWINFQPSKNSNTIRIATNPWPAFELLHLAEKKGFLQEEGLDIQLVRFTSMEDTRRAFELRKIDGMTATLVELMQANEHGTAGKIAIVTDYSYGGDMIIAQSGINSVRDLKGKIVAIEPATLSALFVSWALETAGLTDADVQLVGMNPLDITNALLSGRVDAAHSYPPNVISTLKQKDTLHKIFDSSQLDKLIIDIAMLRNDVIENNPKLINALRRAWYKAQNHLIQHPEEAIKIMADYEGVTPDEFKESLKQIKLISQKQHETLYASPSFVQSINEVGQFLHNDKILKSPPPQAESLLLTNIVQ